MLRKIPALLFLIALAQTASAETIGHWRFENAPGHLSDSSANALTLSTSGTAPAIYPLPATGPGGFFDRFLPQSGVANDGAAQFSGAGSFSRPDSTDFQVTDFTIEAYVHRAAGTVGTQYIASQWEFTSNPERSWGFGVAGTSPPSGTVAGELFLILSSLGSNTTVVGSGLIVPLDSDCYVAASFDAGDAASGIRFHLKNLSAAGSLIGSARANPVTALFNSPGDFAIGAYNGNVGQNRWQGIIDEVRLSDAALPSDQLLAITAGTQTVALPGISPDPSTVFFEATTVSLACTTPAAEIRYTLDGSMPLETSPLYTAPFSIAQNTVVSARAFKSGLTASPIASATYSIVPFPNAGVIQPKHASQITNSNFSVGGETVDRDYTDFSAYVRWLGPLGAKRIRQQTGWAKCEKVPGTYDWAWLDECVDGAIAQGLKPWLETNYGNPAYPGGGGSGLGAGLPTSATALAAYDLWVAALVDRYKDRVDEWEIWNEPDNGPTTATAYAAFYIRTAEIIRARQPTAKIWALALTGAGQTSYVTTFLNDLQAAGKLHLVDAITAHGYPQNPDTVQGSFMNLRNLARTYNPAIDVRAGEAGAPSRFQSRYALSNINWTELTQTKWNLRRLLGDLGHDIHSSIFAIIDMKYSDAWNYKGLLEAAPDLSVARPKQSYFAMQNLFAIFDDTLTRITNFTHTVTPSATLRVFGYQKSGNGKTVATIWLRGANPSDSNTVTLLDFTFTPADFSDPVWIDLRTGEVRSIPASHWSQTGNTATFTDVPVYDSPIVIADRSAIPISTPQQVWLRENFSVPDQYDPLLAGDAANPDNDDTDNLREYLFGRNPNLADPDGLPFWEIRGNHLRMKFTRNKAATDYGIKVAGSHNLIDWSTDISMVQEALVTESSQIETLETRLAAPVTQEPNGFLRFEFTPR